LSCAENFAGPSSRTGQTNASSLRQEPVKAQKKAGAVQLEFSPSKSKRHCGKIKTDGNIAVELPWRLLTFTKHLSTRGVAQGAV
jgi:hypothetical protein